MKRAYIAVVHAFISVVCGLQNFCETTGIVGRLRTKLLDNVRLKYPDEAIIEHNSLVSARSCVSSIYQHRTLIDV